MEKKKRGCCGTLLIVVIIFVVIGVVFTLVTDGRSSKTEEAPTPSAVTADPAPEEDTEEEAPPAGNESLSSTSEGAFESGESAPAAENTDEGDNSVVPEGLVTPSFKEAMDSYEAFFDEYIAFMKKADESDDPAALLTETASYMTRYAETMEKMDEIDEDALSDADLAYYLEVHGRIMQKLSTAGL